jgi:integrase/recombinase XerD
MSPDTPSLGAILGSFFNDHLRLQRGLRPGTIKSYADAMRLFLPFAAKVLNKKVTQLRLDNLSPELVCRFLNSLEESRGNAAQSRNQRLASLRTFFEYIGQRFPERLEQAQRVVAIPRKRAQAPETIFLERDEVESTLAAVPANGPRALRDRALLLFLYNTGARVQEAADLRACDVHLDPAPRVHLHGKGDKWRVCPLWEETAAVLKALVSDRGTAAAEDRPVFTGPRGAADSIWNLQDCPAAYESHCEASGRWPPATHIAACLEAQHSRSPAGGRSRSECDPRLARTRQSGNDQSLRGDYDPYQTSRPGKV